MKLKIALIFMMLLPNYAFGITVTGKVTTMWANQKVWFKISTMPPASELTLECNTQARFVIDLTTDKGKAIYSMILMAKSQQLDVTVVGSDNCDLHHDSEGVSHIRIN